jgi:hypothetical protein
LGRFQAFFISPKKQKKTTYAGTALALVFNGCDGVLFGPING